MEKKKTSIRIAQESRKKNNETGYFTGYITVLNGMSDCFGSSMGLGNVRNISHRNGYKSDLIGAASDIYAVLCRIWNVPRWRNRCRTGSSGSRNLV